MASGTGEIDHEASLAARAAWLYFSGGLTQGEIGKRLGVTSTKAHRLIARASRDGLVRVTVDASVADCVALEETLTSRYGLELCRVAPEIEDTPLPLRTLGLAGAAFLRDQLERGVHAVIGVGHGRTLVAAIEALPSMRIEGVRFVSLLGGLTRRLAANPYDVIYRLADKTGAEAWMLPVPLFANTPADKRVLADQSGVAEVFAIGRSASLLMVGIGEVGGNAFLAEIGMVDRAEMGELDRLGARGEVLGHHFDADGREVPSAFADRAMSPGLEELSGRMIVAVAGGQSKVAALAAVLRSGLLKGLITDEATARRLVG